jgi:hypothetical protein
LSELFNRVIVAWRGDGGKAIAVQESDLLHPVVGQQSIEHALFHN